MPTSRATGPRVRTVRSRSTRRSTQVPGARRYSRERRSAIDRTGTPSIASITSPRSRWSSEAPDLSTATTSAPSGRRVGVVAAVDPEPAVHDVAPVGHQLPGHLHDELAGQEDRAAAGRGHAGLVEDAETAPSGSISTAPVGVVAGRRARHHANHPGARPRSHGGAGRRDRLARPRRGRLAPETASRPPVRRRRARLQVTPVDHPGDGERGAHLTSPTSEAGSIATTLRRLPAARRGEGDDPAAPTNRVASWRSAHPGRRRCRSRSPWSRRSLRRPA